MFLFILFLVGSGAYQYQDKYDYCVDNNFKMPYCAHQAQMTRLNPNSKHYDKLQK